MQKSACDAEATIRAWAVAVAHRDIDRIMASYADPLLVFDVVGPRERCGRELYRRAWLEEFFPWHGGTGRFALRELSVHQGEGVAFATGLIDCAGTENGQAVAYTLRLTLGLRMTADGWRIVHEHSSEPGSATYKVGG